MTKLYKLEINFKDRTSTYTYAYTYALLSVTTVQVLFAKIATLQFLPQHSVSVLSLIFTLYLSHRI